jgi:hypothetical protein
VRLGRRQSGGASARCAGVGTPSGSGRGVWGKETRFGVATVDLLRRRGGPKIVEQSLPRDPARGCCGDGVRPTVALDVAPALSAVIAAPACCWVRREHAIDAMAGGAVLVSAEECAAAPSRSALAAGAKAAEAGRQRKENPCRQLPPAGPGYRGPAARRGSDAVKAVRERRAQAATDQAVRLGAQELRPAGADPPRRRPQARAAQHGRDRRRRDADPQPL